MKEVAQEVDHKVPKKHLEDETGESGMISQNVTESAAWGNMHTSVINMIYLLYFSMSSVQVRFIPYKLSRAINDLLDFSMIFSSAFIICSIQIKCVSISI